MPAKTPSSRAPRSLIRKLRKPTAPPVRVIEDERKYKRSRERAAQHRAIDQDDASKPD